MTDLRRIRIDDFGLILQTARGALMRIGVDGCRVAALRADPQSQLASLRKERPELDRFFGPDGEVCGRLEVADGGGDCLSHPLRIYYGIEWRCNLQCAFCGPAVPRIRKQKSARRSRARESFLLRQIADSGAFQIQLTGGEIFIRGFDLLETLEQTRQLDLAVLLGTNGVWRHIEDKKALIDRLTEFDNVIETKISIEGTEEFHDSVRGQGSYREATDTLFALAERGLPVRINTTIFKESCNAVQLEHVARLAKAANAGLQAIPERSCGRSKGKTAYQLPTRQELRSYTLRAKELRDALGIRMTFNFDVFGGGKTLPDFDPGRPFSCGAGLWGFAVTHLGEVYPCGFAIDIGDDKPFCAGTVSDDNSLLDIWRNSPVLKNWRAAGKSAQCRACPHYGGCCWGGCMIQAWMSTGSLGAMDPYAVCQVDEAAGFHGE